MFDTRVVLFVSVGLEAGQLESKAQFRALNKLAHEVMMQSLGTSDAVRKQEVSGTCVCCGRRLALCYGVQCFDPKWRVKPKLVKSTCFCQIVMVL